MHPGVGKMELSARPSNIFQRLSWSISIVALALIFLCGEQIRAQYFPPATNQPKPNAGSAATPQYSAKLPESAKPPAAERVAASDQQYCPEDQRPPISRLSGPTRRRAIEGDYIIIEYNAKSFQTRWYDYHQWYHTTRDWADINPIVRNGSFLPVVYAKEKVAIHVCGLKFNDAVTVTNSSTGLPEGGADIRGGTIVTAVPTLAPALDSLQTVGSTGGPTSIGGLGFGATSALTSTAVTGIAPGTISHGPGGVTYSDANITASPEQLALMMYAVKRNGVDLSDSINNDFDAGWSTADDYLAFTKYSPNHIEHVMAEAEQRLKEVKSDRMIEGSDSDAPLFDRDIANVQNLANELTNFFASISSQGFGARAVVLQSNYAVLRGPLDLIQNGGGVHDCLQKTAGQRARDEAQQAAIDSATANLQLDEARWQTPSNKKLIALLTADAHKSAEIAKQKLAAAEGQKDSVTYEAPQTLNCDSWEMANYQTFIDRYNKKLRELIESDPDVDRRSRVANWNPSQMFLSLIELREHIDAVAGKTGELFNEVNDWNENSSVEQTDFITPTSTNALERISIVVQHGFVPFTLTTYETSTVPTASVPTAVVTSTTASTSTPAHAVKTFLVEVHRRANFNLVGGVLFIRVPTSTYAVQAGTSPATLTTSQTSSVTTTNPANPPPGDTSFSTTITNTYSFTYTGVCNGGTGTIATYTASSSSTSTMSAQPPAPPSPPNPPSPPGYSCVVQTQTGNTQVEGMVGMAWFPFGRDYFPRRNGFSVYPRDLIPSVFAATSVTSLGEGAFGFNFEPLSGIDFLIGAGVAHSTILPVGATTSGVYPSGYVLPQTTTVHWGLAYGFGFDLSVFTQMFKGGSSAALP